jgi:hypothetical protein
MEQTNTEVEVTTTEAAPPEAGVSEAEMQQAVREFEALSRVIRGLAKNLNAKGVARVLIAVSQFPYTDKDIKFRKKEEHELFLACLHLQSPKSTITKSIEAEEATIKQQAAQGFADELLEGGNNVEQ